MVLFRDMYTVHNVSSAVQRVSVWFLVRACARNIPWRPAVPFEHVRQYACGTCVRARIFPAAEAHGDDALYVVVVGVLNCPVDACSTAYRHNDTY